MLTVKSRSSKSGQPLETFFLVECIWHWMIYLYRAEWKLKHKKAVYQNRRSAWCLCKSFFFYTEGWEFFFVCLFVFCSCFSGPFKNKNIYGREILSPSVLGWLWQTTGIKTPPRDFEKTPNTLSSLQIGQSIVRMFRSLRKRIG